MSKQKKQKNPEKSISERIFDLMDKLSKDQIRFAVALQDYPSKKEAAEALEIRPDTVYHWDGEVDELAKLLAKDGLVVAQKIRQDNLAKAMLVKVAGLDAKEDALRQRVATEIIEWEMGRALQRQDVTSAGEPIQSSDNQGYNRALSSLADALGESLSRKSAESGDAMDTTEQ
jgi:hypothetical protein